MLHHEFQSGDFWKCIDLYKEVNKDQFMSHKWQLQNSLTSTAKIISFLSKVTNDDFSHDVVLGLKRAPMSVQLTPYVLSLIDWNNPYKDPIRKQFIPLFSEQSEDHPMLEFDSLKEQEDSPLPQLVHRYPDKVLFLAQRTCPVYCRFCTRSYAIGSDTETLQKVKIDKEVQGWHKVFQYLQEHPLVEDVVVSGGDVFNMHPQQIRLIGEALLEIKSIRRIRFATKGLCVLPIKIMSDIEWRESIFYIANKARKLKKSVAIHTHINHPKEITQLTYDAMDILFDSGIIVRNQTVLLNGVNNFIETMGILIKKLSYINIQPYYVYQGDLVKGVEDLRTPLSTILTLEKELRGLTAGFNTPAFVVDAPGGGGKRSAWTFEYYHSIYGIAVYKAPAVRPNKYFYYFDPLHSLSSEIQKYWKDPLMREQMYSEVLKIIETENTQSILVNKKFLESKAHA